MKRAICILAAAASLSFLLLSLFDRAPYSADEGFYGVMAINMAHAREYWLRPSLIPDGSFEQDKPFFAHPPFNSYALALAYLAGGETLRSLEVPAFLAFVAMLLLVWKLLARYDPRAAAIAVALLCTSPSMADLYSQLEAEPLLTSFGFAGVFFTATLQRRPVPWRAMLAGLMLGFSFACKLWLAGPFFLAAAVLLFFKRDELQGELLKIFFALALGALLPSALHLGAIALFSPADFPYWWRSIYFSLLTHEGIAGAKSAGAAATSNWIHPFWYYFAILYREHFFIFPFIALGLPNLRAAFAKNKPIVAAVLAGVAGMIPFCIFSVKEPPYILPSTVFLYLLAGISTAACIEALSADRASGRRLRRILLFAIGFAALAMLGARFRKLKPEDLTVLYVASHTAAMLLIAWMVWKLDRWQPPQFDKFLVAACAGSLFCCTAIAFATRRDDARVTASHLAGLLEGAPPGRLSFLASNFKQEQLLLFRRGMYWRDAPLKVPPDELLQDPRYSGLRAFILDEAEQAKPELQPWLAWLQANTKELTPEISRDLGAPSTLRVFVR